MLIRLNRITKYYGPVRALKDVSIEVGWGEFLTIFGPNGAGKTTLIGIVSALIRPTKGEVYIDECSSGIRESDIRRKIGVISHQTFLYSDLTVYENLQFYIRLYGIKDYKNRIDDIINEMELGEWRNERVRNLSRGLQQRVAIARAIIHKPTVLLLDEPFTGLDQHAIVRFKRLLESLFNSHRAIIMTSHNLHLGMDMCTRVLILSRGMIVFEKPRSAIKKTELEKIYFEHTGESS